jgi:MSHA biogenesis protein MshN
MVALGRRRVTERSGRVSVINKMLQELDRRNATAGSETEQPPQQVRAISPARGGREWFWRMVAVLMLAAVGWVGWVAYQLQPGPALATEQAFKAAEQAKKGQIGKGQVPTPTKTPTAAALQAPVPAPSQPVATPPAVAASAAVPPQIQTIPPAPKSEPVVTAAIPKPAAEKPAPSPETMKMAQSIQTPIAERPAAAPPEPKPAELRPVPPVARPTPAPSTAKATVDKRDRAKPASELAEAQFRRAAVLLNQGRVSEAEEQLVGALLADPGHVRARQAYVSLLLEQQRSEAARRVLAEALAANPSQPTFALALARILAEQRDYPGALEVMERAGPVSSNADFLALRGAVLQRMQRHPEAVDAYQASVRGAPQPGTTWVGYGISLEALGRRSDAATAYRRSLGAGGLTREVREYAEARIRALE